MTSPHDRTDDSTRVTPTSDRPHGTSTDADVTSRMAGTSGVGRHAGPVDDEHRHHGDDRHRGTVTDTSRPAERHEVRSLPAKTSAGAAFALVFGLASLFCALTGILAPAAILFGLIGIVLGIAGRKMAGRPGVTGRGVATGGLVTAVLGLLLGLAVAIGLAVYVNDQGLDGIQQRLDDARTSLPTGSEVVETIPGS
ncbi:MAG TPA: DUF4190 domain-containing protein [Mycobacteriales bacterium]|nr:DUF4190 domain-containing protein [Mycobacteriales bacterium]